MTAVLLLSLTLSHSLTHTVARNKSSLWVYDWDEQDGVRRDEYQTLQGMNEWGCLTCLYNKSISPDVLMPGPLTYVCACACEVAGRPTRLREEKKKPRKTRMILACPNADVIIRDMSAQLSNTARSQGCSVCRVRMSGGGWKLIGFWFQGRWMPCQMLTTGWALSLCLPLPLPLSLLAACWLLAAATSSVKKEKKGGNVTVQVRRRR